MDHFMSTIFQALKGVTSDTAAMVRTLIWHKGTRMRRGDGGGGGGGGNDDTFGLGLSFHQIFFLENCPENLTNNGRQLFCVSIEF